MRLNEDVEGHIDSRAVQRFCGEDGRTNVRLVQKYLFSLLADVDYYRCVSESSRLAVVLLVLIYKLTIHSHEVIVIQNVTKDLLLKRGKTGLKVGRGQKAR